MLGLHQSRRSFLQPKHGLCYCLTLLALMLGCIMMVSCTMVSCHRITALTLTSYTAMHTVTHCNTLHQSLDMLAGWSADGN